jgi:ribonucleoside-diphosphate reductase alpha chain
MTLLNPTQEHYWRDRYALRNDKNEVIEEDIDQTFQRVANAIGDDPQEREAFLSVLRDFRFVPAGRILSGAGAQSEKTFYNCYVIPIETKARRFKRSLSSASLVVHSNDPTPYGYDGPSRDMEDHGSDSREAIFDTINTMVGIMSRGGGVGINWSVLRPQDSHLVRVSGTSSGPVGWMQVASTAVGEVIQGGSRRGAAMFMLDIWHPDVLRFINEKRDNSKITNANVSVGVTDKFMEALSRDEDWTFIFPDTTHPEYDSTWEGDIEDWRARGLPVVEWGTQPARRVWDAIAQAAHASGEPGVIFLDRYNALSTANGEERIICVNPCGEQGLGAYSVCNLGAMNLYAYVSDDFHPQRETTTQAANGYWFDFQRFAADVKTAIRFLDNVIDKTPDYLPETSERQKRLRRIGLGVMGLADALVALGIRYGSPDSVKFVEDVFRTMKDAAIRETLRLAEEKGPAGAYGDVNPWVRPFFKSWHEQENGSPEILLGPIRNFFLLTQAPTGTTSLLADVNSGIEPYFNKNVTWREDRTGGREIGPRAVKDLFASWNQDPAAFASIPDYVVDSQEVSVDEHIAIQSAVQRYVDSSVSKTINAPSNQTVEETARAFTRAYYAGLKGIAYYRDGSRDQQVLHHSNPNDRIRELEARIAELEKPAVHLPKAETNQTNGSDVKWPIFMNDSSSPFQSIAGIEWPPKDDCPECGYKVIREEGCMKCYGCGWAAC